MARRPRPQPARHLRRHRHLAAPDQLHRERPQRPKPGNSDGHCTGPEIPLRERNVLLLAAGYAPLYSDAAWNSDEMKSVAKALERMLAQHEPYPAIVMDRYWNVLLTNDAAPRFFDCFVDMGARPTPRNMLHLMFEP